MAAQAPPTSGSPPPAQTPAGQAPAGKPAAAPPNGGQPAPAAASPVASPGQAPAPGAPAGAHAGAAGGGAAVDKNPAHHNPYQPFGGSASFSMASTAAVLYLLAFFSSTFQMIKYKTWYFNLIPQAALMASIGQVARLHSIVTVKETGSTGPYVISMMMSMIAPSLVIFGNIFTFTRIMWWVTPNDKRNSATLMSPPRQMSMLWGFAVMIPDLVKMVGQRAIHPENPMDPTSLRVQTIGQQVQFVALVGFFIMTLRFMIISNKWLIHGECVEKRWRSLGWVTVCIAGLMAVRTLFVQVAFDARYDPKSFYATHEWMYWATQEGPIFTCFALWNIYYPGAFLPFDFCRFKFDVKKIEKAKMDSAWPIQISNPIRHDEEYAQPHNTTPSRHDKGIEITLTEMAPKR
ncbi:RTA1-domain-containing protein [Venturia nashicola]|uniref:RTA1-domain-containing protein n=1 Tax=Venturia nashicola TaxID=86259 RepID=A0A4Z1NXB5_9PEZI|nr:RTA1-domain-containing protein [Venturia nashicola]